MNSFQSFKSRLNNFFARFKKKKQNSSRIQQDNIANFDSNIILSSEFKSPHTASPNRRKSGKSFRKFKLSLDKKFLFWILIILVLFGGGYLLSQASFLQISDVENKLEERNFLFYTKQSEVENYLNSFKGKNYFTVDTSIIQSELNNKTTIQEVKVEKFFPQKIMLSMREVDIRLIMKGEDHTCYLIDANSRLAIIVDTEKIDNEVENMDLNDSGYFLNLLNSQMDCGDVSDVLELTNVEVFDSNLEFKLGELTNSYIVDNMVLINKVLETKGYCATKITVQNDNCQVDTKRGLVFLFSLDESIENQLKKFSVIDEYHGFDETYKVVDLRYERPVIRK